jgi:alpha-D-ribose 1-methylphosphonate 5-triphosphate synthase subunit PhnL
MKTIIALKGLANSGKSATLKKVYEHLKATYPNAPIRHELVNHDVRAVMEIKGRFLGIESQGDPGSRLFTSISLFVREECELIICATRTRGATVQAVEELASQYDIKRIDKLREPDATQHERANTALALDIMKQVEILLSA